MVWEWLSKGAWVNGSFNPEIWIVRIGGLFTLLLPLILAIIGFALAKHEKEKKSKYFFLAYGIIALLMFLTLISMLLEVVLWPR